MTRRAHPSPRPRSLLSTFDRIKYHNRRLAFCDQALVMTDLPLPRSQLRQLGRGNFPLTAASIRRILQELFPVMSRFAPANSQSDESKSNITVRSNRSLMRYHWQLITPVSTPVDRGLCSGVYRSYGCKWVFTSSNS
jgi:hypothetical protein